MSIRTPNPNTQQSSYDPLLVDITTYVYTHHPSPSTSSKAFLHARTALLDALGCAIETLETSPEAINLLGPWTGTTAAANGVEKGFRLPGTTTSFPITTEGKGGGEGVREGGKEVVIPPLDPVKGAFDLGVLIRYLDHSDGFYGMEWGHPSG